jgi:hypothetical protein
MVVRGVGVEMCGWILGEDLKEEARGRVGGGARCDG